MRKIVLRDKEYQYRGYYILLGFILIPATKTYESKSVVKDLLNIY